MKKTWKLTITVPEGQCVIPETVAAVLREAANFMEVQSHESEPRIIGGARKPGIPAWRLARVPR